MLRIGLAAALAPSARGDDAGGHPVTVGDRQLFVHGLGAGLAASNQLGQRSRRFRGVTATTVRVRYSDKPNQPETADQIVAGLHGILEIEEIPGPYELVREPRPRGRAMLQRMGILAELERSFAKHAIQ
jgi:hypothetical protein